jgi:hypothetical protein
MRQGFEGAPDFRIVGMWRRRPDGRHWLRSRKRRRGSGDAG